MIFSCPHYDLVCVYWTNPDRVGWERKRRCRQKGRLCCTDFAFFLYYRHKRPTNLQGNDVSKKDQLFTVGVLHDSTSEARVEKWLNWDGQPVEASTAFAIRARSFITETYLIFPTPHKTTAWEHDSLQLSAPLSLSLTFSLWTQTTNWQKRQRKDFWRFFRTTVPFKAKEVLNGQRW